MIDGFGLAQKLHAQLVNDTAALQRKIVLTEALRARFGADALPVEDLLRSHNRALADAPERTARSIERAEERIKDNLEAVRHLEAMFEERSDADIEAFAEYMRKKRSEATS